jgi:hypothetical protein
MIPCVTKYGNMLTDMACLLRLCLIDATGSWFADATGSWFADKVLADAQQAANVHPMRSGPSSR